MMISSRFVPRLTVIAVIATALAGCAITKIDVDVYKGPLANHEEVQIEQMAVMAIGARPILMQLRDRLEENKRKEDTRTAFGNGYETCIKEKNGSAKFKSDDARRVNAILCLYEDRSSGDLQSRAQEALRAYRKAWRNFQGENRDWKAFTDAMYPGLIAKSKDSKPKSLPEGHHLKAACSEKEQECYSAVLELSKAYGELLGKAVPSSSSVRAIWEANDEIVKLVSQKNIEHRPMIDFTEGYKKGNATEKKFKGSNWAYSSLSNKELVEKHADLLFEEESDKKNEFVATVTSIAKSFRLARSALRDLLQINLDMLIALGQRSDSESAQDLVRRSLIAEEISLLIRRINLQAIVKSYKEKPTWFSKGLQEFADRAKNIKDLPAFKAFLLGELTRNPLNTAAALREADLAFPNPSLPTKDYALSKLLERYTIPERREFGLARVINDDENPFNIKKAEELQERLGAAATGLAGGRLNDGLESMIEDYLEQDDRHKMHDGRDASPEIRRLRDALVRFAQKILFVANYDNLLSGDNQKKLLEYAWDYTGGFVTQNLFKEDERVREYTQVLQAVGNSILNQADELQARETYRDSLKEGADHARYGASRLLVQTPQQTIAAIIDKLADRVDALNGLEAAEAVQKETLKNRIDALGTAVTAINDLKANVIANVLAANFSNDPSGTFLLLKTTVKEKLAMAEQEKIGASEADKANKEMLVTKWQTVWNELDGMNPPMSAETIGQNDFKKDTTSREVLDRLISVLEYERIEAIKQGGTSGRATHITKALDEAYKSRARLTFIRPASSYLRSSNPAASLQNDPGLAWRNELARHWFKSIPVFGGVITRWLEKWDSPGIGRKVLSQIDRQFWQNINSIRVGGAGRTNYVMVQDDIGNWYVKGYSANPEDIIKSAKGLGQFALSGRLGTDLVNRPAPGTGSALARQPTALEAVFDKHKAEYERATEETFQEVKSALDENGLPSEVQKAWDEDSRTEKARAEAVAQLPGAKVHLTEALNELNRDDPNKPEQVAQRPARIVAALRAMDRYRDRLEDSIKENVPVERPTEQSGTGGSPSTSDNAERTTAINAVIADLNAVVDAKIERFLKRREDTAKAYENAIVFAGEIASQAPAPTGETSTPQDNDVGE